MHLRLEPVYSELAAAADLPVAVAASLPAGYALSSHQLETYRYFTDEQTRWDVIINTAMTGDGKSLAAYLPTLVDPHRTRSAFGMYPTNELARDQQRQFTNYCRDWGRTKMKFDALWGARLTEFARKYPELGGRSLALRERLEQNEVILTNPDLFHLMLMGRYQSGVVAREEWLAALGGFYQDFVFDEFHIFAAPQIAATMTAMLLLTTTTENLSHRPRFLFSSATPNPVFMKLLEQSGLRVAPQITGSYRITAAEGYRHILHGADLHLHSLGERQNVEGWITEHEHIIRAHWQGATTPPKGVIIVNSVVEARRITLLLQERLRDLNLMVEENTGFTDDERRREAMQNADLIVGTATIDVGVDFNISLLIFETPDAGTFLQRLGRLGRVRRDAPAFHRYEAHALLSGRTPWIRAKLEAALKANNVCDGDTVERPTVLRDAVTEAFPKATDFQRYSKRWGILLPAHVIALLETKNLGGKHKYKDLEGSHVESANKLRGHYQRAFNLKDFSSAERRYRGLHRKENEPGSTQCQRILDEVLSFRGSSPFQVGVWDTTITPHSFFGYDALVIAQSSTFAIAEPADWQAALDARYAEEGKRTAVRDEWKHGLQQGDLPVVLEVEAFQSERDILVLGLDDWERLKQLGMNQVVLLKGLSIKQPTSETIKQLNNVLRKQAVVAWISKIKPVELRKKLGLPPFFPLYPLQDVNESNPSYTLALGHAALLVEAEAIRLGKRKDRNNDAENAPIFC